MSNTRTITFPATRNTTLAQPTRAVSVVAAPRVMTISDISRTVSVNLNPRLSLNRTTRNLGLVNPSRTITMVTGPHGPAGPTGPIGSTAGLVQIRWSTPTTETNDTIEIIGNVLDYVGAALLTGVVDIEVRVTDGANDGEPSATAYLTAAATPVGIVLAGVLTACLVIRSASGFLAVAIHEATANCHRYLWIKASGHETQWVRAADGVQEIDFV